MEFKSLKEKYMYYRGQVDHRLSNDEYVMVMLDGRSFSKKIKKKQVLTKRTSQEEDR